MNIDTITSKLQKYYHKHNKTPALSECTKILGISKYKLNKICGSWNAAITLANIPVWERTKQIDVVCANCSKKYKIQPRTKKHNNFCTSRCAAIFNNTGSKQKQTTKDKISKTLKESIRSPRSPYYRPPRPPKPPRLYELSCVWCHCLFLALRKQQKTCGKLCLSNHNSARMSEWLSKNRQHVRGPHRQSYMEESFEKWLQQHNITKGLNGYLSEVYFYNKQTKKNGWADFVFPRLKLIIELDGTHHLKRKHLDDIRDAGLKARGWVVFRISIKEYKSGIKINQVKKLLQI